MRKKRTQKKRVRTLSLTLFVPLCIILLLLLWKVPSYFTSQANEHSTVSTKRTQEKPDKIKKEKPKAPPVEKIDSKTVFLTFDDGPTPFLNQFMDFLTAEKTPATFFFVGNNLHQADKKTFQRLKSSPFKVGLHSYTHDAKLLYRKNNPTFLEEMKKMQLQLQELSGISTKLIRAPYGSTYLTDAEYAKAKGEGFHLLDWNIDSNDWRYKDDTNQVIKSVLAQVKNLEDSGNPLIILFHERKSTLNALPSIIKELKQQGYHFKAFSEDTPYYRNFKER
ncbi:MULTISPECIES: polysaccharide deacetylase family protein [unclassified Listeria]|uniref:polysaccharide deacetylase family protein n=1 Tax=unclassified Listeria TaxID=2642072 RepID=UPI000B58989A|nr:MULTISPECIES: polysaccharide deacetylase family protein [unclassified Listeria]